MTVAIYGRRTARGKKWENLMKNISIEFQMGKINLGINVF